jgi:hypothetical protein
MKSVNERREVKPRDQGVPAEDEFAPQKASILEQGS